MQEHALQLLQPYLTAEAPASPSPVLLPRILAAATSNAQPVRAQAVDCLMKAASNSEAAARMVGFDHFAPSAFSPFMSAVAGHHAEILSDQLGLVQVVNQILPSAGTQSR